MTNEDKKIVADYMNWPEDEILIGYCTAPDKMAHFDLNDAGLVVEEIQERYEWDEFMDYCWEYFPLGKDYIGRLFNADNFFNAFIEWRKSK
jgi:hypothetical protein